MAVLEYPERGRKFREHFEDGDFGSLLAYNIKRNLIWGVALAAAFLGVGYMEGTLIFFDSFSPVSVLAVFAATIAFAVVLIPLANMVASAAMYLLLVSDNLSLEEVLAAVVYGRLFSRAPGVHIVLRDELGVGGTKAVLVTMFGGVTVLVLFMVSTVLISL